MINLNIEQINEEKFKILTRINEIYDKLNVYLKNCLMFERTIFFRPSESDLEAKSLVDELECLTNRLTILNDMRDGTIKFKSQLEI